MTRRIIVAAALVLAGAWSAFAQQKGTGGGLMAGEPTGIVMKQWVDADEAWDFGLGISFEGEDTLHVHWDYLLHDFDLLAFPVYAGLGLRLNLDERDDNEVGIRVPVGADLMIRKLKADLFVEVAPVLDVAPDLELAWNAAIGVRYFFR